MLDTIIALVQNLTIGGVHVGPILQAVLSFVGAASVLGLALAPLTKTTADDSFFNTVHDWVLKASLNVNKPTV